MTDYYWHRKAQQFIGQAALTNSKRPESHVMGIYPTHLERGFGATVWDPTGKPYIDFICGLGTNLLGYGYERITKRIEGQARRGASLSLSSVIEVQAAERLRQLFPYADKFKFLKTGSEACSAAIRMARAFTGRDMVLSEGYHGWHDDFVSLTKPAAGVPKILNDLRVSERPIENLLTVKPPGSDWIFDDVAAVIVEPVMTDMSRERRIWLNDLREACTKSGTLLIFDEIITGYRFPSYSVAAHWDITPDLFCIGKAMANGMPLAAVGGRRDILDGDYFVSSTYAGETLSLAAAIEVADCLQSRCDISRLWESGKMWQERFNGLWPEKIQIQGYPTRGVFTGDPLAKALFFQEACKAGLLFGPSWFWNFPLMEEKTVFSLLESIFVKLKMGAVQLEGQMPQSPFAQRVRDGQETKS